MDDETPPGDETTAPPPQLAGKKFRRTLSCLQCQKRKVKCDRVKPCRACCTRGAPSECEYGTSKKDRQYIDQSDLIQHLRERCRALEIQLSTATDEKSGTPLPKTTSEADENALQSLKALTTELEEQTARRNASRPKLQDILAASPSPEKLLLELFVGELINGFSPDPSGQHGSVFDLKSASEMRIFSPLLSAAFSAASLTFIGQRDSQPKMLMAANNQYNRTIGLLTRAVNHPERCKSTEVLVVVVLFTIIEAFKQSSPGAIRKHQLGGLELLRIRTPYRHRLGLDRSLYVDLRMFWVTSAIASRQETFLANDDWMTVPWSEDKSQKDILHHLLDIAVDIPIFLANLDTFKSVLRRGSICHTELATTQNELLEAVTELDRRLQLWQSLHANTYAAGSPEEIDADSRNWDEKFPRFECRRNLSTTEITSPTLLIYPDLTLATTMCLQRALRLVLAANDDGGLITVLGPRERYQLACDICRSMHYFLHNVPGFLISRIMFILRVTFDTFSEGMIEKQFVQQLFWYIGNKYRFPVFMNECVDSATAVRPKDSSVVSC